MRGGTGRTGSRSGGLPGKRGALLLSLLLLPAPFRAQPAPSAPASPERVQPETPPKPTNGSSASTSPFSFPWGASPAVVLRRWKGERLSSGEESVRLKRGPLLYTFHFHREKRIGSIQLTRGTIQGEERFVLKEITFVPVNPDGAGQLYSVEILTPPLPYGGDSENPLQRELESLLGKGEREGKRVLFRKGDVRALLYLREKGKALYFHRLLFQSLDYSRRAKEQREQLQKRADEEIARRMKAAEAEAGRKGE